MPDKSITATIARFCALERGDSIPLDAVAAARNLVLDNIGVTLAAADHPGAVTMSAYVRSQAAAPVSSVVGKGFRTAPQLAALANGTMAHLLAYDETSRTWPSHPSTTLVPAVLAVGEAVEARAKDVMTALIVGWEIGARIGAETGHAALQHGWHPLGTIGSVAAACACANLLKLDEEQVRTAIGISASLASGLKLNSGTDTQPLHAGNAARNGVLAAELARVGFTANPDALDGPASLFHALGGTDVDPALLETLGETWDIAQPGPTYKIHACSSGYHPALDAMLEITNRRRIDPDEISVIEVKTPPAVAESTKSDPKTGLEGKFSLEYSLAAILLDGRAGVHEYTDDAVKRQAAREAIQKVSIVPTDDQGLSPIRQITHLPQSVIVHLRDGTVIEASCLHPRGRPENPLTLTDLIGKFNACTSHVTSTEQRQQIINLVRRLDEIEAINIFGNAVSLLVGPTDRAIGKRAPTYVS